MNLLLNVGINWKRLFLRGNATQCLQYQHLSTSEAVCEAGVGCFGLGYSLSSNASLLLFQVNRDFLELI